MKRSIDLYIVSTPRQWWIACALVLQSNRSAIMLIDNCFNGSDVYAEVTRKWGSASLIAVELLNGKNEWLSLKGVLRYVKKTLEPKIRKKHLQTVLSEYNIGIFFTASVRDWLTQYAVYCQPSIEISYLDDGIRTYQEDTIKCFSLIKTLHKKITHGFWYSSPKSYSNTAYLKSAYVFHAAMVNSDIKTIKVIELNKKWFVDPQMISLANAILNAYDFDSFIDNQDSQSNCILVFTKLSILQRDCPSFEMGRFKKRLQRFVNQAGNNNQIVWVKYHPREVDLDIYDIAQMAPNVKFIPASIPFDILISLLNKGDTMLGEISTVLFDVALRRSDVDVFSIDCLLQNPVLATPFQKVGVSILECTI